MRALPFAQAQAAVLEHASANTPVYVELKELVEQSTAYPAVLAGDVIATRNLPAWPCSAMDGYGVRSEDVRVVPSALRVIDEIVAGVQGTKALHSGQAVRIMTGAPIPSGVDSVVPIEKTRSPDRSTVEVRESIVCGANIRQSGEDLKAGQCALPSGTPLTPAALGVLASQGNKAVEVISKARVCVFTTGDELVPFNVAPKGAELVDSNSINVRAHVSELGCAIHDLGICPDTKIALRDFFTRAMKNADVVITCGGVSVGERDYVKEVFQDLGGELIFWGVEMKPGKPMFFGRKGKTLFFGLPGNPVAVSVGMEQFVRPALLRMMGYQEIFRPSFEAQALSALKGTSGKVTFVRVVARQEGRQWTCDSSGHQGSHVLSAMAQANALAIIPAGVERIEKGESVRIQLVGPSALLSRQWI